LLDEKPITLHSAPASSAQFFFVDNSHTMLRNLLRAPVKETSAHGEIAADDNASASSESYYSDDDDDLSGLDSGGNGEDESSRDEEKEIQLIIRNENKAVMLWREIVTGMLVITAVLVTVTTYIFLSREEVDDFSRGVSPTSAD
jgi:hypothetical protein